MQRISAYELKTVKQQGVSVALAGVVISLIYGLLYAFGGYAFYLSLHLNIRLDDYKKFFMIFPLTYLSASLTISLGDKLIQLCNRINVAVALLITILGLSFHLISYIYSYYLVAAILILIVSPILGTLKNIPFRCTSRYFPTFNNRLNSLFQISNGVGAAIFTLFFQISANWNNLNLNDFLNKYEIGYGLKLVGACCYAAALFVLFHLKYKKDLNTKLLMDYEKAAEVHAMTSLKQLSSSQISDKPQQPPKPNFLNPTSEVLSTRQALLSKSFFLIIIMSLVLIDGFLITSSYKLLIQRYSSKNDRLITLFACIGLILFGVSRYIVRQLIEKIGFKKLFFLISLFQTITFVLFQIQTYVGVTIALFIFIQGLYINWFTLLIPRLFGYRLAINLIQVLFVLFAIENIFIHIMSYYLETMTIIKISGGLFLLSNIATIFFRDQVQWINV